MTKELTAQDNLDSIPNPMDDALKGKGITAEYLAQKLEEELNAFETKTQIPKGSKKFAYSKSLIAWDVRQKARQDTHKLRGDYAPEKSEHTFDASGSLMAIGVQIAQGMKKKKKK